MKEYLLNCIDRTFDDEDYYKINKYIEKLEEEIKRQSKAQVILDDELADLIDYKSRIDKAIEYCNTYTRLSAKDLLEILRGESDE